MKKIIALICVLILFSCVNHDIEDVRMIKTGMSVRELKYYMGEPYQIEIDSDEENWHFEYMYNTYKQYLVVSVVDGKVVEFYTY